MMETKGFAVLAVVVAGSLSAGAAGAQEVREGAFEVTPYVALFKDAYDIGADGSTGALAGLRVGYALGERARLLGNVGYGEAGDVARAPAGSTDHFVYENQWVMTTAGAEYDLIPGRTAVAMGLQVGAGWRQVRVTGAIGHPADDGGLGSGGYAFYDVVVPSIAVRRVVAPRATLQLGFSDYMFDVLEASVDHSPALSLGLTIR